MSELDPVYGCHEPSVRIIGCFSYICALSEYAEVRQTVPKWINYK